MQDCKCPPLEDGPACIGSLGFSVISGENGSDCALVGVLSRASVPVNVSQLDGTIYTEIL